MTNSSDQTLSRRGLLTVGATLAAAAGLGAAVAPTPSSAAAAAGRTVLNNVRLETGYTRDAEGVSGTTTGLFTVVIENGRFSSITPSAAGPGRDAGGLLMLPSFRDMHVHLDKTYFGGPWVPPRKRRDGIQGQIMRERTLLPQMLPTLEFRTGKLVDLLQSNGTTFARSQCNVDPVIGVQHVEHLKHALDGRAPAFGYEIVAFPQHGFISADLVPTMRRAMEVGATHVGGIDPTAVDQNLEKSVDTMLAIAVEYNKSVDMHLHEPGATGIAAIRRVCDQVEKEPRLKGKVTFSHCFSLMSLSETEVTELAARMGALGMTVASTIPFGGRIMPIPILQSKGVKVVTGTDSVLDFWSVFGSGDVLEKAKLACQLYGWSDEYGISQSLKIATGGPTPLDADGKQAWPKVGDSANFVLVAASCSAETVARLTPRKAVFHNGALAFGAI